MSENKNLKFTPITCPRCGSRELAFVPEYHKSIVCRILSGLLLAFLIIFNIPSLLKELTGGEINMAQKYDSSLVLTFFFCFMLWGAIKIIQVVIESRTHTKAICKNCGNFWIFY